MTYRNAKKLHNEDEVIVKETGEVLTVLSTQVTYKNVFVECNDGNMYHHREIA